MPRDYKKRNPGRRPGYKSCAQMAMADAAKALAIARSVKAMFNVEYKSKRTAWTADPNTTGAVLNLITMIAGDDFDERSGRKVKLFSIAHKGSITMNGSATDTMVRAVVVRDNLGTTTQPSIADMFGSASNFFNNLPRLDDPQTNARFTTLYDKWFALGLDSAHFRMPVKSYKKIGSHVTWTGTANTDEGKGTLYLMIASSEVTNDPIVNVVTTIKFIDN